MFARGRTALAAAGVALLVLAGAWLARTNGRGGATTVNAVEREAELPPTTSAVLVAPQGALDEPGAFQRVSTREPAEAAVPRGPLRGRLLEAESRAPLGVERIVLLAAHGNAVAETLRSRADGSFASTRDFPRG